LGKLNLFFYCFFLIQLTSPFCYWLLDKREEIGGQATLWGGEPGRRFPRCRAGPGGRQRWEFTGFPAGLHRSGADSPGPAPVGPPEHRRAGGAPASCRKRHLLDPGKSGVGAANPGGDGTGDPTRGRSCYQGGDGWRKGGRAVSGAGGTPPTGYLGAARARGGTVGGGWFSPSVGPCPPGGARKGDSGSFALRRRGGRGTTRRCGTEGFQGAEGVFHGGGSW